MQYVEPSIGYHEYAQPHVNRLPALQPSHNLFNISYVHLLQKLCLSFIIAKSGHEVNVPLRDS